MLPGKYKIINKKKTNKIQKIQTITQINNKIKKLQMIKTLMIKTIKTKQNNTMKMVTSSQTTKKIILKTYQEPYKI